MIEPVFKLIPRAAEVGFTEPYSYFGYAVGIIPKENKKFNEIEELNKHSITIAVNDGSASQKYADKNLAKAKKLKVAL